MAANRPNRAQRKDIAERTLKILDDGFYEKPCPYSGDAERVDISTFIQESLNNSICYTPAQLDALRATPPRNLLRPGEQTELSVARINSIAACRKLWKEYKTTEPDTHIACLNFASAKNPCGGMKGGSLAQEESLGLASALHTSLVHFEQEYYNVNKADPREGFYNDNLIYSPSVAVFRDDEEFMPLLQKKDMYAVTFLTCPAVNAGRVKGCKDQRLLPRGETPESTMRRRVENVLCVAAEHGVQALVLGAWGCGVFKNKPEMIAGLWKEFLVGGDAPYSGVFRKVVFAMGKGDEKNAAAFQKMLLEA